MGMATANWIKMRGKIYQTAHGAAAVLYGMTTFEWAQGMRHNRAELERLFFLITFGDLVGLPLLPPYYAMRLLPYITPVIYGWKRNLLRERDLTDLTELIKGAN
jgi:hypothetical protein